MKSRMVYSLLLLGAFTYLFVGCAGKKEDPQEENIKVKRSDSIAVFADKAEIQELTVTKTYTGTIEGEQQANIVSQLAERIVEIPVHVGSVVGAGQVLIKLDKSGATSQYYQAQSNLKNFERNLTRMKNLYESGAVSKQNLDDVQTGYDVAKANFEAAKAAVEITSPISGVVTEVKLNPGDFASPGMPIITVAKINSLKIKLSIGEADIPYVNNGQVVDVYSELNPSVKAKAKINEISKSADLSTRTFEVKAIFPNSKDQWFKPGMFAKADLNLTSSRDMTTVPRESVIYTNEGPKVFIIKDGKAYSQNIKLGLQNETMIEVTDGLTPDALVVKVGMNNLKDGSAVTLSDENLLSKSN